MSEANPQGCQVEVFKDLLSEELSHDYSWRVSTALTTLDEFSDLQTFLLRGCAGNPGPPGVAGQRPTIATTASRMTNPGVTATKISTTSSAMRTATGRGSKRSSRTPRAERQGRRSMDD